MPAHRMTELARVSGFWLGIERLPGSGDLGLGARL